MIQLYYWPTPNGHKISIMLEEVGLPYQVHPINILKGDQFQPEFLRISPNNKIPAIVDPEGPGGGSYSLFESGAILLYLAEKTGRLCPTEPRARFDMMQWLMFQMGNIGPMFGQNGHFQVYAREDVPYAKARYHNECKRLYGVMDRRLGQSDYLAGTDYSVADIATYAWCAPSLWKIHRIDIDEYPNVKRWVESIGARPAVQRGVALLADTRKYGNPTDEAYGILFGNAQYQRR